MRNERSIEQTPVTKIVTRQTEGGRYTLNLHSIEVIGYYHSSIGIKRGRGYYQQRAWEPTYHHCKYRVSVWPSAFHISSFLIPLSIKWMSDDMINQTVAD
jgi:hypothetical protein